MAGSTLFVRNLPPSASNEQLLEVFSEVGPVKQCFVVRDKGSDNCRGFGYVTFSMQDDAQKAITDVREFDGKKIIVVFAKKKLPKDKKQQKQKGESKTLAAEEKKPKSLKKSKRKARLIIRNLSFKCSEDDLKAVFSKYGVVLEVDIPRKEDGKMRGFAFVQFKNVLSAGNALKEMNMKEIKGRPVAVDWAVAKDKYKAAQGSSSSGGQKETSSGNKQQVQEDDESGSTSECDSDNESKPQTNIQRKQKSFMKVSSTVCEEEERNVEEDSEVSSDEDQKESEVDEASEEEEDEGSDTSGSDSEDEDQEVDSDDEKSVKKKNKTHPTDVNEGRTVFIRNLSFDTEEEDLGKLLEKFGDLNYVRIVVHPDTEHSKGCAFAQFKTKEAAQKCIESSLDESEGGGLKLDGRKLKIDIAVTREEAVNLRNKTKAKKSTGSRNLYLAREGFIRAGTKAAEGLSEADLAKRARFEELKRQKLKNVNVFVSKTRLCVHNLPKSVDNKQLRKIVLKAAGGGKDVRVKECRVMCDLQNKPPSGVARSLGYAFVEFQEPEHALKALRELNNDPEVFGPQKRPIVEFSLEDRRKLQIKANRAQRNLQKQTTNTTKKNSSQLGETEKQKPKADQQIPKSLASQNEMKPKTWSGFQTKAEADIVVLPDGKKRKKVLPLPSHRGPKIRKRDVKVKHLPVQKPKFQSVHNKPRKQKPPPKQVSKTSRPKFRNKEEDKFNKLVDQYKKKILGNPEATRVKKSKWFNT
ncbi:RNA-binding protein 28 [Protopterus annectens]|uniref:RNA-binding protein 28 n=1 Tax=Protopterus annectens TaxID=7888 RepID=UPI001CF95E1F|nr:RNA-binding protein 28 [Protopterus annectens]